MIPRRFLPELWRSSGSPIFFAVGMLWVGLAYAQERLALDMIKVTGLEHEIIEINPNKVVAIREPRPQGRAVHNKANCTVLTADGKFVAVLEHCAEVERRLEQAK